MAEILIVEDELSINELIRRNLSLTGHHCTQAFDGLSAVKLLENKRPPACDPVYSNKGFDLIVLDIMLPGLDGYQVYERALGIPTIFLTAKSELTDKLRGLAMGADDYLTKPFQMLELAARVEAVLRRTKKGEAEFVMGDLKCDFNSHQVFLNGTAVECTPKEYELLEVLIRNRNIALSREKLLDMVWGYDFEGGTRTVDVHIQRLRHKLHLENNIRTVYKPGYRLEVQN
ncbi:MAG: response regulator transcription factor [Lachnospiraceae bacterium]|nr:response regulator transcription factor [Lachnospiraceae bacterium]